ncbi:MAG: FAD-binding oxidoreductase [Gammaproteobacteria bacterium]|jgi:glycine/D-amino acid oxidase-like deaminating enzyme|nr:FAD-binding oxidoreductase [Gammaproteobacteria bacterium]
MSKLSHQNQEHCASYYAATANDQTRYATLAGGHKVDVCVVGAGFSGIATALTLSERGYKVAVVEANRVGWGASGRNGGQLIGGISGEHKLVAKYGDELADTLWAMRWRGHEIIHERVTKYAIQCDLKGGYLDVAIKPRHMRALEAEYGELQRRQFPHACRLVEKKQMAEVLGTDAYIGGLINHYNGHLHPLNLCKGEAAAAVALGAEIFEQSPVTRIEHASRPRVHTAGGHVEAEAVVLAGNAYHRLERTRLSGLVFPAGSYIVATEPLHEDLARQINPLDLAVCDPNAVLDYFRLSADRRLLFGGRCNYSGREPADIKGSIVPRMLKILPQLKGKRIDYAWGGNIGIVVNRIPLLGRVSPTVFYTQGYSGHGVNFTHVAGEIMADAVGGTMERLDLFEKIKHWRIPFGQAAGSQMVALGMLYYRLKDWL